MSVGGADFSVGGRIEIGVVTRGLEAAAHSIQGIQAASEKAALSLHKIGDGFSAIGAKSRAAGQTLTLGITAPLLGLGALAVNAASDLSEAVNLVDKIFGSAGKGVIQWSKTTADAMGIAQTAALSAAANFGGLFETAGQGADEAAKLSQQVIGLGADLASAFNTDPADALAALRSGLIGESEPLLSYNILLKEAAVNQEAVRLGLAKSTDEVSDQAKIMARYSLILKGAQPYLGDFADTQDGLANVTRRVKAQLVEVAAAIGQELLPPVLRAAQYLNTLAGRFQGLDPSMRRVIVVIALIAAALGPALFFLGSFASGIGIVVTAIGFLLSPLGVLLAGLAALAVVFRGPLFSAALRFGKFLLLLGRYFVAVFKQGTSFNKFLKLVPQPLRHLVQQIGLVVEALGDLFRAFKDRGIEGFWQTLTRGGEGQQVVHAFQGIASALLQVMVDLAARLLTAFAGVDWAKVAAWVADGFAWLGGAILAAFTGIDWGAVAASIRTGLGELADTLLEEAPGVLDVLTENLTRLQDAAEDIDWDALGQALVDGVADAYTFLADNAPDAAATAQAMQDQLVSALVGLNWDGAGGAVGRAMGEGLARGIVAAVADPQTAIATATAILRIMNQASIAVSVGLPLLAGTIAAKFMFGLIRDLIGTIPDLIDALGLLELAVLEFFVDADRWLREDGVDLITGLIIGVSLRWNQFTNYLSGLWNSVPVYFQNATTSLFQSGYDLITGLINGIAARWNDLVHYLGDLASHLPDWIKDPLGMSSPSKVFAAIGADTAEGFFLGYRDQWLRGTKLIAAGALSLSTTVVPPPQLAPMAPAARTVQAGGVTINVHGAGDPQAVAAEVYRSLDAAFGRLELESRR